MLLEAVIPRDEADKHSAILEIRAGRHIQVQSCLLIKNDFIFLTGAGGVEASLFAAEVYQMYQR